MNRSLGSQIHHKIKEVSVNVHKVDKKQADDLMEEAAEARAYDGD